MLVEKQAGDTEGHKKLLQIKGKRSRANHTHNNDELGSGVQPGLMFWAKDKRTGETRSSSPVFYGSWHPFKLIFYLLLAKFIPLVSL